MSVEQGLKFQFFFFGWNIVDILTCIGYRLSIGGNIVNTNYVILKIN